MGELCTECTELDMSTLGDCYEVRDLSKLFTLVNKKTMYEDIISLYPAMACKKTKSPVLAKQAFDSIQMNTYKPAAKMVALRSSKQKLPFWLLSFVGLYKHYLPSLPGIKICWEDNNANSARDIKITVYKNSEIQYTITVFIETGTIQCQGCRFSEWAKHTFPCLKGLMEQLQEHITPIIGSDIVPDLEETTEISEQGNLTRV